MPLCSCQSADFTGLPGTSQHRVLHHIGNNGKGKGATLDSCCASRRHFENMSGDLALIQKLLNIIRLSLQTDGPTDLNNCCYLCGPRQNPQREMSARTSKVLRPSAGDEIFKVVINIWKHMRYFWKVWVLVVPTGMQLYMNDSLWET